MSGGTTGMDIRLPIGLMFGLVGAILTIFGAMTQGSDIYAEHSLGININLWWGMVLFAFGVIMLILCWIGTQKDKKA
jgi:lipopolysaccharide export LptBFGC system permease protein LptF